MSSLGLFFLWFFAVIGAVVTLVVVGLLAFFGFALWLAKRRLARTEAVTPSHEQHPTPPPTPGA